MKSDNLEKITKGGEEILFTKNEQNKQEETPLQKWDTFSRFLEGA